MSMLIHTPALSPRSVFDAAAEQRGIARQNDASTPARFFPPRFVDAAGSLPLDPSDWASGGSVVSATQVSSSSGKITLALVDLSGGGRLLCRILCSIPAAELIGRAVRLVDRAESEPFLMFGLVDEGRAP